MNGKSHFAYFLHIVFHLWHKASTFDSMYFGNVVFPVLARFVRWSKEIVNLKGVYKCLLALGVPSEQIERSSTDAEKIQKTKVKKIGVQIAKAVPTVAVTNKKVFIVHGHNKIILLELGNVLSKAGLSPIVLHEQINSGQTTIEKFEKNADVGAAIVLLTADDKGKSNTDKKLMSRARQNVLLELGYFIGKLGREKVIPLYEEGVELPSDFEGVVYELLDSGGRWKFNVLKELRAMGYDVDANSIL